MEAEILKYVAGLGVGGIIAVIVILIYRADRKASECQLVEAKKESEAQLIEVQKQIREDRKFMEDRLTDILTKDQESREENTKALTELTTVLTRMNGKH